MNDLFIILDYVEEGTLVRIYDNAYSKYLTKEPMTLEQAEDWLEEHKFVFDGIKARNNLLIICIESA